MPTVPKCFPGGGARPGSSTTRASTSPITQDEQPRADMLQRYPPVANAKQGPRSKCWEEDEESNRNLLDKGCPKPVLSEGARGEGRMGGASPF